MSDSETIRVAFNNAARTCFFDVLHSFSEEVKSIDRSRDEHRYQALHARYMQELRKELEHCATDLLRQHRYVRQHDAIGLQLQHEIGVYMHEFVQKTR